MPTDYTEIERPYNNFLEREEDLAGTLESGDNLATANSPADVAQNVISGQALEDIWVKTWIKSTNYKPKVSGFFLDGMTGYIEANKLFIGEGGIIGGSLDIPDKTSDDSFHVDANGNTWWGANVVDGYTLADAYVLKTGIASFKNVSLSGSVSINDIVSGSEIAIQGWTHNIVFSSTDSDTVSWLAGTITLTDTTTYSILAGNTGNMAAKTYIYLDIATSTTALQITTTAANAVGSGKILIAVAQNDTTEATFIAFGENQMNIDGAKIAAQSITASEIEAGTITANEIAANTITANNLSTALLYAGTITLDTDGAIKGGQTAFNSGIGFFLGYSSGEYRLSIGDPATDYLTWSNGELNISGYVPTSQGTFGGSGVDGELNISSGTTSINCNNQNIVVLNYTSVSITGTAKLAFINPATDGTIVIIKSQGDVTITSSDASAIDLQGMGAAGGIGVLDADGTSGTNGFQILDDSDHFGVGGTAATQDGGAGGLILANSWEYTIVSGREQRRVINLACGSGGGGGGGSTAPGIDDYKGGDGGRGGGCLVIECRGAFNFTTTINCKGENGDDALVYASGGGGGGGGGMALILYNELTENSGTISTNGGDGGDGSVGRNTPGGVGGTSYEGGGGGGGGAYGGAGGTGGDGWNGSSHAGDNGAGAGAGAGGGGGGGTSFDIGQSGGAGGTGGATGNSLVTSNSIFA